MSRPFQIYQISRGVIGALEQAEGVGGAVAVMTVGVAYLLFYTLKIKTIK